MDIRSIIILMSLLSLTAACSATSPSGDSSSLPDYSYQPESVEPVRYSDVSIQESKTEDFDKPETQFVAEHDYSGYRRTCSQKERYRCLALAWGPDVCSLAFEKYAEEELDTDSYDTLTSPLCGKMISDALDQEFTENDIAAGVTTGLLDDLGSKSWEAGGFWGAVGAVVAKGASFTIKTGIYYSCIEKCEDI